MGVGTGVGSGVGVGTGVGFSVGLTSCMGVNVCAGRLLTEKNFRKRNCIRALAAGHGIMKETGQGKTRYEFAGNEEEMLNE